jgi:hypothetical protein
MLRRKSRRAENIRIDIQLCNSSHSPNLISSDVPAVTRTNDQVHDIQHAISEHRSSRHFALLAATKPIDSQIHV